MTPLATTRFSSRPSFRAVLTHRLFRRMAREPLNSDQLINFLVPMGDFCAYSRPCHRLPDALRELGHTESAEGVECIAASEAGHGPQFERMAIELVYSPIQFPAVKPEARMRWHEIDRLVDKRLLEPTYEVIKIFASRHYRGVLHVPRAIGIMLAVEMIAHESIIPGEVMVFIDNPHYQNMTLDHPSMAYLREHAGVDGAEAWHAALMESVVTGELLDHRDGIDAGFDESCTAIATWYSAIERVLFEEE